MVYFEWRVYNRGWGFIIFMIYVIGFYVCLWDEIVR